MTRARGSIVAAALVAGAAHADPDLRVRHFPTPRHLHMRAAQQGAPAVAPDGGDDDEPIPAPLRARAERAADRGVAPDDTSASVRFRMDLGFGVDGAQASGDPNLVGHKLAETPSYDPSRGYGFGDLYVGSHGLVLPSLSTYLAAHAQFLASTTTPPLPSAYDRGQQIDVRSGWAEADNLFDGWLSPIRVRAGRQYIYGPATAHVDGLVVGYETRVLRVHLFGGTRVPDWNLSGGGRDSITGADLRVDFAAWKRFPAVIDASTFAWGAHDHAEVAASVTRGKGLYLRGSMRTLDGRLAHEQVTAHFRVSDVTRVVAELDHRSSYDWRWDPEWVSGSEPGGERRYLELGTVGPRATGSVRAGTVLLDNIDVLVRAAGALDQPREGIVDTSFASTWGEIGGALEVRLRRTLAIGSSVLFRRYTRVSESGAVTGTSGAPSTAVVTPLPLPDPGSMGELSLFETGFTVRYSAGARKLSASGELYARRIHFHHLYDVYDAGGGTMQVLEDPHLFDLRGGGRFSLEAWVTPRFRLRAEYELSTGLDLAPEVLGFKSLRILAEGSL